MVGYVKALIDCGDYDQAWALADMLSNELIGTEMGSHMEHIKQLLERDPSYQRIRLMRLVDNTINDMSEVA